MRHLFGPAVLLLLYGSVASAEQFGWAGAAEGAARAARGQSPSPPDLLLFGGTNNKVFLGCLNCSELDASSVHNAFGEFGNPLSAKSLKNHFATYGNPFSPNSACNEFGTAPPVVVDRDGKYYGELTLNEIRPKRIKEPSVVAWLQGVCK